MRCCCLRLTNTYGRKKRIADSNQSFIGGWIRAAIEGRALEIWGGEQLRDLTYVDDVVDALLLAALNGNTLGKALNVDGDNPVSLRHIAEAIIETSGDGQAEVREFPTDRKLIDIGDYYGDDRLFRRLTGWAPRIDLKAGLLETITYFRTHFRHYV